MKSFLSIFLFLLLLYSCSKDSKDIIYQRQDTVGCDSMQFSYATDIRPIIAANCSGAACHFGGNNNYDFSTYAVLADRIRHGRMEYVLLLPPSDTQHMPQNATLKDCELYRVVTWIRQGFPDN